MKKEIIVNSKKNDSFKLILKVELDEEAESLIKKRLNLLALLPRIDSSQLGILETLFGYYWYKDCEMNILKQDE